MKMILRSVSHGLNACDGERKTITTSKAIRASRSAKPEASIPPGPLPDTASPASKSKADPSAFTGLATVKKRKKPAKSSSPTQKTLYRLNSEGYATAIVEKWNPHAKIRQDLFGFIDILALGKSTTLAIQTCSRSDLAAHRTKILEHANLGLVLAAGWEVQIWAWKDHRVAIESIGIESAVV